MLVPTNGNNEKISEAGTLEQGKNQRKKPVNFIALMIIFSLVVAIFSIGYIVIWRVPDNSEEAQKLLATTENSIDAANAIPVNDNAWFLYYDAAGKYVASNRNTTGNDREKVYTIYERGVTPADYTYIETLKKKYGTVLLKVDEGYAKPYFHIPLEFRKGTAAPLPDMLAVRSLAHLLTVIGDYEKQKGHPELAARRYLQVLYIGQGSRKDGDLIRTMIGYAVDNIVLFHLRDLINETNEDAAFYKQITGEMEKLSVYSAPPSDMIAVEMLVMNYTFNDLAATGGANLGIQNTSKIPLGALRPFIERERKISETWQLEAMKNMKKPYPEAKTAIASMQVPKYSLLAGIMIPNIPTMLQQTAFTQTTYNGVEILAALKWYRKEKGGYPDTLEQLAPEYLKKLPEDIYAGNSQFLYRKAGEKIELFSIGNDHKNDNGLKETKGSNGDGDIVFAKTPVKNPAKHKAQQKKQKK